MPEFIIQSGKHAGKKLVLDNAQILIGRDDVCTVRISSREVSRQHCVIQLTEAGWIVRDLGSQNGTYVNDARVDADRALQPGDVLHVGPMMLKLVDANTGGIDEDIVGWLSESDGMDASGDTTIISAPVTTSVSDDTSTADATPPKSQRTFKNVAEEAADIIRRHRKMTESENG